MYMYMCIHCTSLTSKGFGLSAGTWTSSYPFLVCLNEPPGSWQRLLAMKWLPSLNTKSSRSRALREPSCSSEKQRLMYSVQLSQHVSLSLSHTHTHTQFSGQSKDTRNAMYKARE